MYMGQVREGGGSCARELELCSMYMGQVREERGSGTGRCIGRDP